MKAGALREGVQRPGHCRGVGSRGSQFAPMAQGERDAFPRTIAGNGFPRGGSVHLPSLGVSSLELDGRRPVLFSPSHSDAGRHSRWRCGGWVRTTSPGLSRQPHPGKHLAEQKPSLFAAHLHVQHELEIARQAGLDPRGGGVLSLVANEARLKEALGLSPLDQAEGDR